MAPHSSTLAWKIPWMEEPGRLQSMESQRVGHDWSNSLHAFIGEGHGTPLQCSCLENPRTGEPGGLPSVGSHRVGHDCSDSAAAAAEYYQISSSEWLVSHFNENSNFLNFYFVLFTLESIASIVVHRSQKNICWINKCSKVLHEINEATEYRYSS